ncbi:MAG: Stp1/IreP family PP2C-type Ser/Thr phosphatase [Lachnospiraceae bacterium]|nr:Stp1/IreP family PP2C-type Ser/Thr phosphatase [Lachnospiraceae bacterium]
MKTHALTDIGLARNENQDCFYTSEMPVGNLPNLFVVADGMGGHVGGKCASHTALQTVIDSIKEIKEEDPKEILDQAIQTANSEVMEQAKLQGMEGMGTTIVAATIIGEHLYVANVGDSRLYIVTPKEMKQITIDHSLVEEMVRMGELDPDNARNHERKNVITRAIGVSESLKVDFFDVLLSEESIIVLCSDGLTNMVDDSQIRVVVNSGRDVIEITERLIDEANKNGGKDNITVVVIEP